MVRFVLAAVSLLLALGTGVSAECEACPNCDYENISIQQGDACLNYWTCSGDTITCYYPSVANPGTFNGCSYSASASWTLTAGPSDICFAEAGLNSKSCTASYGLVDEYNIMQDVALSHNPGMGYNGYAV
ncbi:uncharacterized protein EDB93DRAFT_1106614 [Suillus bovinus]|uniref:uncharacterized protein n=1 Tax=Suillus bovinus TaxID=48563 RepID=UPI001B87679F|nr:uncharacterized protein EDB93DRAFT_1106614 [Suillus bovinus]KAG2137411.1 hypothetical protein EDB93DRAFT_1106614 [Suillus bovinus]